MNLLKRLAFRTEGQDLIEYGLLASIISVSVVLVLGSLGTTITTSYDEIETALSAPAAPPNGGGPGNGNGNGNGRGGGNNSGNGNGGGRGNGGGN